MVPLQSNTSVACSLGLKEFRLRQESFEPQIHGLKDGKARTFATSATVCRCQESQYDDDLAVFIDC